MKKAAFPMRTKQASMAEIAESVGYSSESAFCYAFKRVIGEPPKKYSEATFATPFTARTHEPDLALE
jgi:AraC-like DNA-binding protein